MDKEHRKKIKSKLIICIILFILLVASYKIWLPLPGIMLFIEDNIEKADCIVPLEGDLYFRFRKAVELYNKGYSRNIVVSLLPESEEGKFPDYHDMVLKIYKIKEASPKEFTLMAFKYFGKDSKDIYFTDKPVTSTYEEAVATKNLMLKKGFKSLIIVTSVYHTRRAKAIYKAVFKDTDIKIYNCAAGNEVYNPYRWWLKERDVRMVTLEYLSMIHNFIYHFLFKKERTSFDNY